jgi:2-(3-amino-3-carboxypropyl)histidine synthase
MNCIFNINNYLIDFSRLKSFASSIRASRLLLEAPQGMVQLLPTLAEYARRCLEDPTVKIMVNMEPSYGLCSVSLKYILEGIVDGIVHVGHDFYPYPLCIPDCRVGSKIARERVLTVPAEYIAPGDTVERLAKALGELIGEGASVAIGYTTQHRSLAASLSRKLEELGVKVRGLAQVLGCYVSDLTRVESDFYAVIAGGYFHSLGVALAVGDGRRVLRVDPYEGRVENVDKTYRRIIARRYWAIMRVRTAKRVGVIVGTLPGQYRPGVVDAVVKLLERYGLSYELLYAERLSREYLDNLNPHSFDAFIVTSCPRLAIDDLGDYWKPVITPGELAVALRGLQEYVFPW